MKFIACAILDFLCFVLGSANLDLVPLEIGLLIVLYIISIYLPFTA